MSPKPQPKYGIQPIQSITEEPPELIEFADVFCPRLILENGKPLELYPGQRLMLREYFSGIAETLVLQPKKNGKTSVLAALALSHLLTTPDAAVYIGAASRDQAKILFSQALGLIRRSGWLESEVEVKVGYNEIRSVHDSGMIKVLAADANTADGVLPSLALVDELHRHKSADLYGIFRDGLGPRNGRMITISTAGDHEDSPLGKLRTKAYGLGITRSGAYRTARSKSFVLHEWSLEATDDVHDMEVVQGANPAPWMTVEALERRHDSPSMNPASWARFACGIWGLGAPRAFESAVWDGLADPEKTIKPKRKVVLGFDGARRRDTTGLIAVDIESGFIQVVGFWQRPPDADADWEIPETQVDQAVEYAMETWDVWRLYGDPPYWEAAMDRWAGKWGEDKVVRWWTNRIKNIAIALRAFNNDMKCSQANSGEMSHDGDPDLAQHIRNSVKNETRMMENDEPLWTIRKESSSSPNKIDLAMATVLAWTARGHAISAGVLNKPTYSRASW